MNRGGEDHRRAEVKKVSGEEMKIYIKLIGGDEKSPRRTARGAKSLVRGSGFVWDRRLEVACLKAVCSLEAEFGHFITCAPSDCLTKKTSVTVACRRALPLA